MDISTQKFYKYRNYEHNNFALDFHDISIQAVLHWILSLSFSYKLIKELFQDWCQTSFEKKSESYIKLKFKIVGMDMDIKENLRWLPSLFSS